MGIESTTDKYSPQDKGELYKNVICNVNVSVTRTMYCSSDRNRIQIVTVLQ